METATQERATRGFEPLTTPAADAAIAATQRVIGDLTELSIGVAKENARLAAELQMTAIDAIHESQAAALRWQALWPEGLADPLRLYQRAFMETVDSTQRALTCMGANARVVVHAVDRLQASVTDTGRRVRETLAEASRETTRRG